MPYRGWQPPPKCFPKNDSASPDAWLRHALTVGKGVRFSARRPWRFWPVRYAGAYGKLPRLMQVSSPRCGVLGESGDVVYTTCGGDRG